MSYQVFHLKETIEDEKACGENKSNNAIKRQLFPEYSASSDGMATTVIVHGSPECTISTFVPDNYVQGLCMFRCSGNRLRIGSLIPLFHY